MKTLVVDSGCSFIFGSLRHFIAKCDRQVLMQHAKAILLQNAKRVYYKKCQVFYQKKCDSFITKCNDFTTIYDSYCKMRPLLQNASVQPRPQHIFLL